MKCEKRRLATDAPERTDLDDSLSLRDYILLQAAAPWTVRRLEIDFAAEVIYSMAVHSRSTR